MFRKIVTTIGASHIGFLRSYCIRTNTAKSKTSNPGKCRALGQPTSETHPHLLNPDEVTPLITKTEYQQRRCQLIESIMQKAIKTTEYQKNHLVIVPGCQEPDCCLVITIDESSSEPCSILFTRDKDGHAELWDGPRTHPEDVKSFFGMDRGLPMSEFEGYLRSYGRAFRDLNLWYDFVTPGQKNIHTSVCNFMSDLSNKKWENPRSLIHNLRLYKSPAEIALMQKAGDITAAAFVETMSCSRPNIGENQLFAKIDYECRMRGAEFLAYPPVVAGGNRANIIHYINNNQLVEDGEMVLMDAGCEYHGYASDVTRTWPINGKFTPEQREIYEVVYCVQEELIELCNKCPTLDALFESMCYLLGKRLQEIGLISIQPSNTYLMKAAYQLCPHHVSHYLGMDIHDTPSINRNIKIEPGMVITVEPGVYISNDNKSLPKSYHGIGIRIEDDILITVNGPVVLSRKCPKHPDEIEKIASENQS